MEFPLRNGQTREISESGGGGSKRGEQHVDGIAPFRIKIKKVRDGFELQGTEGTLWKKTSFKNPENNPMLVHEDGVTVAADGSADAGLTYRNGKDLKAEYTTMRLRTGSSMKPLIVVDGVANMEVEFPSHFDFAKGNPKDYAVVLNLSPADIESIEVIKDAAAAAWGSEGTNGIVLVKTKNPPAQNGHPAQFKKKGENFAEYVQGRVRYPKATREKGIQGTVQVELWIDEEGKVSDIQVISSPDESLSREVVSVVGNSPKWEVPGIRDGKPARAKTTIPVTFKLDSNDGPQQAVAETVNVTWSDGRQEDITYTRGRIF